MRKAEVAGDLVAPDLIEDKVRRRIPDRSKGRVFGQLGKE
jgi:hypothetical protein